ncbi:sorting nexin 2A-like [Impatiens glandulifera]|uniref:sorting nexin 2A-like n=1 Tax=Impatiens glandulifera TaxID=253017 RepID=UPI001FB17814|nr:sorting nexin 2A-like [Impatiens glandulifera]
MMGEHSDNNTTQQAHLYTSPDEMESLLLDEPSLTDRHFASSNSSSFPPFADVATHDPPPLSSPSSISRHGNPLSSLHSLLEPPSYAEAVFRSFDRDQNGTNNNNNNNNGEVIPRDNSGETSSSSSPTSMSDYIWISVSDPQKEQELSNSIVPGGNAYFTYLITTRTNMRDFNGSEFSVRRRFKDIVTLSDRLSESYRGFFIPLRPDKNVVDSQVMQKQEFVEQRRIALEKYLQRLAAHPVIKNSDELRLFLQVQGKLPLEKTTDVASRVLDGAVKMSKQLLGEVEPIETSQPARGGGRDFMRFFKELKQYVATDWGGSKPAVIEEDNEFVEKKEKLLNFEREIITVSQQAESLVKAQQDFGETMGELGLAFVKLTKFETEEAVCNSQMTRASDMKNIATASVKASRLCRELNAQTVKHFGKIHEYLGVMLAVNNAFSERSSALLTVQTLLSELSSLESRIEKLEAASSKVFGGDSTRIRKIDDLKDTVRVTEDAKSCAIREYERIKENNKTELERLEKERQADFLSMLRGFVVNQVGYAEKMAKVWETVAEEEEEETNDIIGH